MLQALLMRCCR